MNIWSVSCKIAVRAKDDFRMFISCMITDLAKFEDKDTGIFIEHWTEISSETDFMRQDTVEVFIVSHIVLGCLEYSLPDKTYNSSDEDNAMLACGEIYYWSNRADLNSSDRKLKCQKAWNILLKHETGTALSAIKECECSLKGSLYGLLRSEPAVTSFIDTFPMEISEICRYALKNKIMQKPKNSWRNQEELFNYAISILGLHGRVIDLPLLRSMVDHQHLGTSAIKAIQQLEYKVTA